MSRFLFKLAFLLVYYGASAQQVMEGIHYATGKPVQIEIKDGRILNIKAVRNHPGKNDLLFVAPGFFDNQVNGFAGVSMRI